MTVYTYILFISTHKENDNFIHTFKIQFKIISLIMESFYLEELFLFYLFCGPFKLPSSQSGLEMKKNLPTGMLYDSFINLRLCFTRISPVVLPHSISSNYGS